MIVVMAVAVMLVAVVTVAMVLVVVMLVVVMLVAVGLVAVMPVAMVLVAVMPVAVVPVAMVLMTMMLVAVARPFVRVRAPAMIVRAMDDGVEAIQSDLVDCRERPHRHVQRQPAGLDLIGRNAIAEQRQRLVEQRGQYRVVIEGRVDLGGTHGRRVLYGIVRGKHEVCRFGQGLAGEAVRRGAWRAIRGAHILADR